MSGTQALFPLTYLPNLASDVVDRLPGQDRDKAVVVAIMQAFGEVCQRLEDSVFDFATGGTFLTATGAMLDKWGAIVNQPRLGLVDADYRRIIGAKILIDRCPGGMDAIAKIVQVIAGPFSRAWTVTAGPMVYYVGFVTPAPLSGQLLRFIKRSMVPIHPQGSARSVAPAASSVAVLYGNPGTLLFADLPVGTPMISGVAGETPVPDGFVTSFDVGTFARTL
jgi:hypothetical protein